MEKSERKKLKELAKFFFWLGCVGFGGPAVHIAMMEEHLVRKRRWLTSEQFLDLVGATNLIPGPNSTELTMHIGHQRAGWRGLITAGICFIFPAVVITAVFAILYQNYGQLPEVQPFIYGIKPAIIAVILSLMIGLGRKAFKNFRLITIGLIAGVAVLLGASEIVVLFAGGLAGIAIHYLIKGGKQQLNLFIPLLLASGHRTLTVPASKLFLIFLKIGSILYGSGYLLFGFLDAELVAKGLLSKRELVDAIAVGQFTPGPVFSSATFVGWQIGGIWGALASTIGIFLPSFLFVALLNPLIPKLRKSEVFGIFLDAVNAVSIAIIMSVIAELGKSTIADWRSACIAVLCILITLRFKKLNTAYIIFLGAFLGYILQLLG